MSKSKTVNRGHLLRWAKAGKLVAVEGRSYDDMLGEQNYAGEKEVNVIGSDSEFEHGKFNVYEQDFKTKSGCAYESESGEFITVIVHSNCSYTLKKVA